MKEFGLEIPEDNKAEFEKKVAENYKTTAEVDKKVKKLESERDDFKAKYEDADTALKGFEGIDKEEIEKQLKEYKERAEKAETEYKDKLYQRDFEDALNTAMGEYKFTSTFAQKAIMEEVKNAGLKLQDGKILGLNDLISTIKEKDSSAFVDEEQATAQQNAAKFTQPLKKTQSQGAVFTVDQIKSMTPAEINANWESIQNTLNQKG